MTHSSDNLAFYALLGFGGGIYFFFKGFRELRKSRVIADTPQIPIRSIPMGLVEIRGQAKGEQTIPSPVSRTPCLLYKVVIERWERQSRGRGGHTEGWKHHRTDVDGANFYLDDSTGQVLVDAHGAELDLPQTACREARSGWSGGTAPGATNEELLQYVSQADTHWGTGLAERGLKAVGPLGDPAKEQKRQMLMGLLEHSPGTPQFQSSAKAFMGPMLKMQLEGLGPQSDPKLEQARQTMLEASNHPTDSPEFQAALQRAEEQSGGNEMVRKYAAMLRAQIQKPGAGLGTLGAASGRYRLTEYLLVPGAPYSLTGTCVENPHPRDEHDRNMIVKGTNEKVYLISSKTEKEVEKGLRWRAAKMIFGGAAVSLVCLAILLGKAGLL